MVRSHYTYEIGFLRTREDTKNVYAHKQIVSLRQEAISKVPRAEAFLFM